MSKENRIYNWQSKATNYALRADMNEAEFIQEVTDGLLLQPTLNVAMNEKKGMRVLKNVPHLGMRLIVVEFEVAAETAALILILEKRILLKDLFLNPLILVSMVILRRWVL
jgi:hypothetical protein